MSVKVGVRVRPFNKREEQMNCRRCIAMEGNTTHLIDSYGNSKPFVYDYSFWSHDNFTVDTDGINVPVDDKYADQRKVFNEIGSSILINAWEGYNCCLFAYGQTGSGKSYSMIGYGANKGIIPIVCEEIFNKINGTKEKNKSFQVNVSMMEIYNQTLKDLLTHKQNQLKICERKNVGVFVQGLKQCKVISYQQIQSKIQEGSNNRSIAATLMNQNSSRSHTIVSIKFTQKIQVTNSYGRQMNMKYSVIHLVDLAGSECVAKTGAISKDRLRETAKINMSLSTLGRVIQILADNAGKIDNKAHVPYRDSKLTFILRNALGGNSQTAMICAISPADDNYQQTLSTLRYAQRAKKIQNKAIINQSDVDKLVRMLREENEMLRKLLREAQWNKTVINESVIQNIHYNNSSMMSMGYEVDDDLLLDMDEESTAENSTTQDKPSEKQSEETVLTFNQQQPYITNISQDQQLSLRVKYPCKNLTIGNKTGEPKPDVILATLGIMPQHSRIFIEDNQVFIEPLMEGASEYIFLNGGNVLGKQKLYNLDRLIFGIGCVFVVKIMNGECRKQIKIAQIDYQYAIGEMNSYGIGKSVVEESQIRKKIFQEYEMQYSRAKIQNEEKRKKQLEEQQAKYRQKVKQIEQIRNLQASELRRQLQAKQLQAKALEQQKNRTAQEVLKYLAMQEQMKKQNEEKKQYEQTVTILQQKISKVRELEEKIANINIKEIQMKNSIIIQEEKIRKQLEVQTIICNNQNILNQYKLQYSKKIKSAKELRDLLVKKQKIELQKQLIILVPMVERFNLIAKEMNKKIQCGLSVQYRYISQTQVAEVLKTKGYKSKFQIIVHVLNREEKRSYYWPIDVFQNRYELAVQLFQLSIMQPNNNRISDKGYDPYWDPIDFQPIGNSFLMAECILYGLCFKGKIQIISHRKSLGSIQVQIKPCNFQGQDQTKSQETILGIQNPRELLEKTIYFSLSLNKITLNQPYEKICIEYELLQDNYKMIKFKTQQIQPSNLTYKCLHTLREITQNTLLNFMEKPIIITVKAWPNSQDINLCQSFTQRSLEGSFGYTNQYDSGSHSYDLTQFSEISPPRTINKLKSEKGIIYDNNEVLGKIQTQYEKKTVSGKKKQQQAEWIKNRNPKHKQKDNKDKECMIF